MRGYPLRYLERPATRPVPVDLAAGEVGLAKRYPNDVNRFFSLRLAACSFAAVAAFSLSCARVPESRTGTTRAKQLVVQFRLRGPVDINRQPVGAYYFVVINRTDNPTDSGPAPVTGTPWGNGFAAPRQDGAQGFVAFVLHSREVGINNNYLVATSTNAQGQLVLPVTINALTAPKLGAPDFADVVVPGSDTLGFRLDLSRLPLPGTRYVQINIIATDRLPQGADDVAKRWDALGDGRDTSSLTSYITLDTRQNTVITNDQQIGSQKEPQDDVRDRQLPQTIDDPSLDIVDWRFQIRDI